MVKYAFILTVLVKTLYILTHRKVIKLPTGAILDVVLGNMAGNVP